MVDEERRNTCQPSEKVLCGRHYQGNGQNRSEIDPQLREGESDLTPSAIAEVLAAFLHLEIKKQMVRLQTPTKYYSHFAHVMQAATFFFHFSLQTRV
jgi:hypothetical protein